MFFLKGFNFKLDLLFLKYWLQHTSIKSFKEINTTEPEHSACTEMLTVNDSSNAISPNSPALPVNRHSTRKGMLNLLSVDCNANLEEL